MGFKDEPVAWIGLIGTIIVGALTTIVGSGLVTGSGLDVLNVLVTIIPIIAGLIGRRFVSPVAKG